MRKLYLLLAITFLFQSCFTYKHEVDPNAMVAGKTYKIKHKNKSSKVIFKSIADSAIVVTKDFEEAKIPLKDIKGIKKRKFSIVKTVVYPLGVVAAITGLFVLAYSGPSTGGISFSKL